MRRLWRYLWASPTTLGALPIVLVVWLSGGTVRVERGALEASGGRILKPIMTHGFPWIGPVCGMTLGHVILGLDEESLCRARDHEHVHVRQYERWGPFMLPAYFIASGIAWWRGGDPYRDNRFEREAYSLH